MSGEEARRVSVSILHIRAVVSTRILEASPYLVFRLSCIPETRPVAGAIGRCTSVPMPA